MPAIVTSQEIDSQLRLYLENQGFSLSIMRQNGETGADIIATKENQKIYFETIAYKSSPPARSKDFYEIFFRCISRLDNQTSPVIMALPKEFKIGLPARAKQYGPAWKRIGTAFPELEIWLICSKTGDIEKSRWNDWAD